MMRIMMNDGTSSPADAFWPAHTIWLILGDTSHAVKNKRSIMVSPIVAGLKESVVKKLGWDRQSPGMEAFLAAARNAEFGPDQRLLLFYDYKAAAWLLDNNIGV